MWVDLKKFDQFVETEVLRLIHREPDGIRTADLYSLFSPYWLSDKAGMVLKCPGWNLLSKHKRCCRLNKVIFRLISSGRIKREKGVFSGDRFVPLDVLDKIVFALEFDE